MSGNERSAEYMRDKKSWRDYVMRKDEKPSWREHLTRVAIWFTAGALVMAGILFFAK